MGDIGNQLALVCALLLNWLSLLLLALLLLILHNLYLLEFLEFLQQKSSDNSIRES